MKILGIDTATQVLALGIIEEDKILSELRFNAGQTHAQILLPNIQSILKDTALELEDLDGIALSIGPGSFTGLRIGLATAKGLCFASGKPLLSVPTLDGLVYFNRSLPYPLVPVLDAKKNEVYSAVYNTREGVLERISDYWVLSVEKLVAKIPEEVIFLGLGLEVFRERLKELCGEKAHFLEGERNLPSGSSIAFLGLEKFKRSEFEDLEKAEPLYLRSSEAELKFKNV
ncbi:MAG: tRNA (adenosine(37)-N6)-threonylcarbamoyltransferase complex dimerization subunit type 1 TsaB [candidate division Zixibacteria bacterium]|nr:tRNA (adenosine(37)-N6)-threonylcarbamoyltransferase complex dimerization subunit type 1 TsaB [candidate division Zixibacteria bacterium]